MARLAVPAWHTDLMAVRGWNGRPPQTEEEARQRILEAASRCLDRYGPAKTSLSDVAAELGVTRQTVYRRFPSTTSLLLASTEAAAEAFIDQVAAHCASATDPTSIVTTAVVFVLEHLDRDSRLSLLLAVGRADLFTTGITSPTAINFGRSMLRRFPIDWAEMGYDDHELGELAEHLLRIVQSMVIDPGHPPRSSRDLSRYLVRWVAPAITRHADTSNTDSRGGGAMHRVG
jgi:AcrR family transcriptional regulator